MFEFVFWTVAWACLAVLVLAFVAITKRVP